jgi:hypothetical protein
MEELINADNTVHGVTDTEGVKDPAHSDPEGMGTEECRDADGIKKNESGEEADLAALESEFDRLISGRFSEVYKRRTEGIIRRRLRSGKARPKEAVSDGVTTNGVTRNTENEAIEPGKVQDKLTPDPTVGDSLKTAKAMNAVRPIENGIGGSCGVVSKINVNALKGKDVLSILKRVGAGERINFK